MNLTKDQEQAKQALLAFLLGNNKEFQLIGEGGTGKSYLISWFNKEGYQSYLEACNMFSIKPMFNKIIVCATTNKAAEVLASQIHMEVNTIHHVLKLKVDFNYKTGVSKLKKYKPDYIITNTVIFIDEASMIDKELYDYINNTTYNCKIVYVGDNCQLKPVANNFSVFSLPIPSVKLNQQVRFTGNQGIINLAQHLRNTVLTHNFTSLLADGQQVVYLDNNNFKQKVCETFKDLNPSARIVTYTNEKSKKYNDFIRHEVRSLKDKFTEGEHLISANVLEDEDNKKVLGIEDEVVIYRVMRFVKANNDIPFDHYHMYIDTNNYGYLYLVRVPADTAQYNAVLKDCAKRKDWYRWYYYTHKFADLRPRDSCTIHKVQGTTIDDVFVDLTDIGKCTVPDTAARLLYVACTRARKHVYLCGKLPKKYGGSICLMKP